MRFLRRILICSPAAALAATSAVVTAAGPAAAAHVACGQTITQSTTLDDNVGPCAEGLVIGASNITLDLNGFTVSGQPAAGEGPGIDISGRTGVTVRNGRVTDFDAGVAITGGSGNTATSLQVLNNRGTTATDFGDGVTVFNSTGNTVNFNEIRNNGPYSGVSLIRSSDNLVENNQIAGNNQSSTNTSGIRVENVGQNASNANTIRNNVVQGSGLDGIQLFAGSSDNRVVRNLVLSNNRDGITAFAGSRRNTIEDNQVRYNGFGPIAGHGIYVRGAAGAFAAPSANVIRRNISTNNFSFDLRDGTPSCGTNLWTANQAGTGTPPCVLNP